MILTQMEAPSSLPLPPAGTEQVVEGAECCSVRLVGQGPFVTGGVYLRPKARTQAEQVLH